MAKRYIRINWQNAPSVATPRNAENLNIMDKGLDDLDLFKVDTDAIVNNLVTTEAGLVLDARQGKVLDGKVNELTNNLVWEEWQASTLNNGWTGTFEFRKNNIGLVSISFLVTSGTVDTYTILANLPPGYRPVRTISTLTAVTNGEFYIDATGNFCVGTVVTQGTHQGDILFLAK